MTMNILDQKIPRSRRQWLLITAVTLAVWITFAFLSPAADYIRCYTWMVKEPWRYQLVSERFWTQNPPYQSIFMAPFVSIPEHNGYIVFMAFSLAAFVVSAHLLGGKPILVLISAQMLWILWWGQIEIFGVLAVLLGWYALQRGQAEQQAAESQPDQKNKPIAWIIMFLALTFATFKPQISLVPTLALWWWSGRDRWKSMLALVGLVIFSLWAWGPWPVWYAQGVIRYATGGHAGMWNASLGLWTLPLFIPALMLPLNRQERIIALAATAQLASPYLPYYSTILLLCFAIPPWAYFFAFLGFLPLVLGTTIAWNGIALLPLLLLVWLYAPLVKNWLQKRRSQTNPPGEPST